MRRDVAVADLVHPGTDPGWGSLDPARVAYYEEHWSEVQPVVVYDVHGSLVVADGHHRVAAAQRLGRTSVSADVRRGERADALRFAVEHARRQRGLSEAEVLEAIRRRTGTPPA